MKDFDHRMLALKPEVFGFILKKTGNIDLANDLYQDLYIKAKITLETGVYFEEGKFVGWIKTVARNMILDYFRKENRKPRFVAYEVEDKKSLLNLFPDDGRDPEQEMIRTELINQVQEEIEHLPDLQKKIIKLRYYEGKNYKEIIAKNGGVQGVWASRLHTAIKKLKRNIL